MQRNIRVALAAVGLHISVLIPAASADEVTPSPNAATHDSGGAKSKEPAAASSITQQSFGQWALQCTSDKSMNPPCQIIYQLPSVDQKIATVISLAKASGGTVGMQVAVPLGFAIQGGVRLAFGNGFSMTAAVSRCTLQGCLVEGIAPANLLAAMLKEKSGQISLRMLQGGDINLPVNLDGFAQAFQAMSAKT